MRSLRASEGCVCFIVLFGGLCCFWLRPARATEPQVILSLTCDSDYAIADGHSLVNIGIEAWLNGTHYTDPVQVSLTSTLGSFDSPNVTVLNGSVWTHLRAGAGIGTAQVSLQVVSGPHLFVLPTPLVIAFLPPGTSPPTSSSERYVNMRADDLSYAIDFNRMVALQRAHFHYRGVDISGDHITLDVATMEVRAEMLSRNPVIISGFKQRIRARRAYLNFTAGIGQVLLLGEDGSVTLNSLSPVGLLLHSQKGLQPPTAFTFPDNVGSQMMLRASRMDLYPGSEIRCKSASLFVNGKQLFKLPYYRYFLNPNAPNADQYVSYDSTNGLAIDVPLYYMLSQNGVGALHIQHSERAGFFGTSTDSGWALGIQQDYGQTAAAGTGPAQGSGGTLILDRINDPDWGVSWRNNERIGKGNLSTYVYSTDHESLEANVTASTPFRGANLTFTTFGNHQLDVNSLNWQATADLPQKAFFGKRAMFSLSTGIGEQISENQPTSSVPVSPPISPPVAVTRYSPPVIASATTGLTPSVASNMYLVPWKLGKGTTFAPSISERYSIPDTGGYLSSNAGLNFMHSIGKSGSLNLIYNWSASGASGASPSYSHQSLTGNLLETFGNRVRLTASPSYDFSNSSLSSTASFSFAVTRTWTFDIENHGL